MEASLAQRARDLLAEVIDDYGIDGVLRVVHEPDDLTGISWDGVDLVPHDGMQLRRETLRDRVWELNFESRTRPR